MGNTLKSGETKLDAIVDSYDDQERKDHTVAGNNDNKIQDDEKSPLDDCASDKELGKQCQPGIQKVPKKSRTPRIFIGQLTCKPGEDTYEFCSAQMIIDEKNKRESEKRHLVEDYIVSDGVLVEQLTCEPELTCERGDDACQYHSAQMIIDEKNSRKSKEHPLEDDYIVSNDDNGVESSEKRQKDGEGKIVAVQGKQASQVQVFPPFELTIESGKDADEFRSAQMITEEKNSRKSKKRPLDDDYIVSNDDNGVKSSKKRQKNGENKIAAIRGRQASQIQNYPPSELPQNLQDYISKLNLEAPLLFVAQKILFVSDIRRDQNRLLLPKSIINPAFFENYVTDKEMKMLMEGKGVRVSLVDNKMHEYHTLNFAKWNMNSTSNFVLKTTWFDLVKDNKLDQAVLQKDRNRLEEAASSKNRKENLVVVMKEDDKLKSDVVVQVWCSRKEGSLWFALNMQAMIECNLVDKTKDGRCIIKKLQSD